MTNANLYLHFQQKFYQYADKTALITERDVIYTYNALELESARIATYLSELGLRTGARVSVQVEKSPQALFLYLACLRAGLVFHPLNTGYTEHELEYFLSNAEPSIVVSDQDTYKTMVSVVNKTGISATVLTLNADGSGSLIDNAESYGTEFGVVEMLENDLASLLYSSGTTGRPKGIMLTHNNLLSNSLSLIDCWRFSDEDVLLHALPIFHVHGLFVALGCALLSGATMRWLTSFDAKKVLSYLPTCSVMMGVPTYYTRLLAEQSFDQESASNMRLFISGSAPLLVETFNEFEARTGHRILERYGMSETNMNTSNPLDGKRKPGTVGLPLPGVYCRVVDEHDKVLPQGEVGNLQVKGDNVFKGYWKMPEKTLEDFTMDGFFNTGDKGQIDKDGYVSIVGRAKDMVITGGLNVYPKEIELTIDELPEVQESAVIGVPHIDFGEGVVAVIVTKAGTQTKEDTIISALKEHFAAFKVPKRVVFVEELPRNTMGKVQKNILRERFSGLLS